MKGQGMRPRERPPGRWWDRFRKKKELHGINEITKHFNLNFMDVMGWIRNRVDRPPIKRNEQNILWCEAGAMKKWLTENDLMPKNETYFETIVEKRNRKNAKRKLEKQRKQHDKRQRTPWQIR
jgi:hypothetical protein